jgi:hypothetical protein
VQWAHILCGELKVKSSRGFNQYMNGLRSDGFLVHTLIGVVMEYLHFQVVNHVYIYGHLGELSNVNENKYEGC